MDFIILVFIAFLLQLGQSQSSQSTPISEEFHHEGMSSSSKNDFWQPLPYPSNEKYSSVCLIIALFFQSLLSIGANKNGRSFFKSTSNEASNALSSSFFDLFRMSSRWDLNSVLLYSSCHLLIIKTSRLKAISISENGIQCDSSDYLVVQPCNHIGYN